MQIVDRGTGTPVVLIPGIQGRWEWMAPAVDALARQCRVVTFSLCDEPSSGFPSDPARGVENYLDQLDLVFERTGLADAVVIGVSYSGPIAMEFTVRHPERVRALILVSALPPDWQPDARARFYLRAPLLFSPIFFIDAPVRAFREVRAALPRLGPRARFSAMQLGRAARYFLSPTRMATRIHWLRRFHFSDPSGIRQPVMVITGEQGLDRVVAPALTHRYVDTISHARHAVIPCTGHLCLLTKPDEFTSLVCRFLNETSDDARRATA
ncbi:MAG TPA: alpha/beta hydrolase [Vicinamibacterales bacterium]|nr:alpha/beta hydrolase [Vicinamibacterales bacterium]